MINRREVLDAQIVTENADNQQLSVSANAEVSIQNNADNETKP
jgi:hypothetical protein